MQRGPAQYKASNHNYNHEGYFRLVFVHLLALRFAQDSHNHRVDDYDRQKWQNISENKIQEAVNPPVQHVLLAQLLRVRRIQKHGAKFAYANSPGFVGDSVMRVLMLAVQIELWYVEDENDRPHENTGSLYERFVSCRRYAQ